MGDALLPHALDKPLFSLWAGVPWVAYPYSNTGIKSLLNYSSRSCSALALLLLCSCSALALLCVRGILGALMAIGMDSMPPQIRKTEPSGLDYVGRGFWFALGFTPVFILLTTLAFFAYINIMGQAAEAQMRDALIRQDVSVLEPQLTQSIGQPLNDLRNDITRDVSEMVMPADKRRARDCRAATKEYLSTRKTAAQQRMYELCYK